MKFCINLRMEVLDEVLSEVLSEVLDEAPYGSFG